MRLAKNIVWNASGTGVPLVAAVIAVPPLIDALGTVRFGILTLAWVVIGYFSFFDFGMGRAMTQVIAQKTSGVARQEIPFIAQNGMIAMILLGMLGGGIVAAFSPWLVWHKLSIPEALRTETLDAFFLLAASIPLTIATVGLRGILEGIHRFDVVNLVKAPLGALIYLAPLAVLPFSATLPTIIACILLVRLLFLIAYAIICVRLFPELIRRPVWKTAYLRQLLSLGGWMTLSNLTAPLLLYLGRFALAILISAEAVAYFSTPYDVVINLLLIQAVCNGVLFPTFAQNFSQARALVGRLYKQWMRYTFLMMLPLCLLTYFAARPALAWWINATFSENSYRVAQLLAIGIFINSFGHLSQSLIQAYGRPDLTAKLHVAELLAYIPYMWWLIQHYGAEGAALSWIVRVTISTIALGILAQACLSGKIPSSPKKQHEYSIPC